MLPQEKAIESLDSTFYCRIYECDGLTVRACIRRKESSQVEKAPAWMGSNDANTEQCRECVLGDNLQRKFGHLLEPRKISRDKIAICKSPKRKAKKGESAYTVHYMPKKS